MHDLFIFRPEESIYELTFLLAVIVRAFLFFHEFRTKGYSLEGAGLIMLTAFTFFLIGSKLMTFSTADWDLLFSQGQLPNAQGKTLIGGLLFGYLGFYLATSVLKARFITPDVLAIALPVAMGIQRIGCLTTGCCHGELTESWFGIQYDSCSVAGMHQISNGWLSPGAELTHPVFPVPLILSIGCFLIAGIILVLKRRGLLHQGYFLVTIALYLILTFFMDFFREGFNNPAFGKELFGLKVIQWAELSLAAIAIGAYLLRKNASKQEKNLTIDTSKGFLLILVTVIPAVLLWNWFSGSERMSLVLTYIPVAIFLLERQRLPVFQWYRYSALASVLALISIQFYLTAQDERRPIFSTEPYPTHGKHSYNQVDFGYEYESNKNHEYVQSNSGCGGNYYSPGGTKYNYTSHSAAGNYGKTFTDGKYTRFSYKAGAVATYTREIIQDTTGIYRNHWLLGSTWGGISYDSKWLGGGVGLGLGYNFPADRFYGSHPKHTGNPRLALNIFYSFRLFPEKILFLFADNSNYYFNNGLNHDGLFLPTRVGLGSGFGQYNGTKFKLGVIVNNFTTVGFTGEFSYFFRNSAGINLHYLYDGSNRNTFSAGLSYRFNQQ